MSYLVMVVLGASSMVIASAVGALPIEAATMGGKALGLPALISEDHS